MVTLGTEVAKIQGLPKQFLKKLEKLNIRTVEDLLWHFPTRYEDFSRIVPIANLALNQSSTIRGLVKKVSARKSWKRRMAIVEALIVDESGGVKAVWFNQPYIAKTLRQGETFNFAGRVSVSEEGAPYLANPLFEPVRTFGATRHTAGIIPVYRETKGLTSKGLRYLIQPLLQNLGRLPDFVPDPIREELQLPDLSTAIRNIHFPKTMLGAERAQKRFAFEDLFLLQINNLKLRSKLAREKAPPLPITEEEQMKIIGALPFTLTDSQRRSLDEIISDIAKPNPMNRLLQGDVGSGKTVVAAIAALTAAKNNKQTAFMAPTEVLARQHYETLTKLFRRVPDFTVGFLVGAEARAFYGEELESSVKKPALLKEIVVGKIKIVVGTHALITPGKKSNGVDFADLGLAIVDEQHRFGVEQRAMLVKRERRPGAETTVHFLSMSATPIPRTLSLTLFGDLDLSIIDELPKGRKPVLTKVVDPANRDKAYAFVRGEIRKGRQAFVICPRIEIQETDEPMTDAAKLWADVKNVKEEYERLAKTIFPDLRVGMLHGKMKAKEKQAVMAEFTARKIDILVSTSVIEVGVDQPNASIMIIEGADRFGLAQLYQFRGRVGRGEHQSFCFLFTNSTSETTKERLNALLDAKNGFELAEKDLAIRGPGQFLGEKQTGLPDVAMRSLSDIQLVKSARAAAEKLLKEDSELRNYPLLQEKMKQFENRVHLE